MYLIDNNIHLSVIVFKLISNILCLSVIFCFDGSPQPSWDRTCTAAAAASLLFELQSVPQLSSFGLAEQVEAVEDGLESLLEALTARRLRRGRSITRKVRHNRDIC